MQSMGKYLCAIKLYFFVMPINNLQIWVNKFLDNDQLYCNSATKNILVNNVLLTRKGLEM